MPELLKKLTELQWGELQRDPKGVAALADRGDVRVRRRDGVLLAQVIVEWKATAAVHADPALAEELSRPLDDDLGHVPAPESS